MLLQTLLFALLALPTTGNAAYGQQHRILAVYTTSAANALYMQQLQLLAADEPGLKERDLLIKTYVLTAQTGPAFKAAHIKGDFTITLTGKDGSEKYRSTRPITLQKLYGIIDAMPMRQQEMKKNK